MTAENEFMNLAVKAGNGDARAAASMLRLMRSYVQIATSGVACAENIAPYLGSIASECDRAAAFCDGFDEGFRAASIDRAGGMV
jgi:hypothetical protein